MTAIRQVAIVLTIGILSGCAASATAEPSASRSAGRSVGSPVAASPTPTAPRSESGDLVVITLAGSATVQVPDHWHVIPFLGQPAPVYFPIDFISTTSLATRCTSGGFGRECSTAQNWFEPDWTAPSDGFVVLWAEAQIPGSTLDDLPGNPAAIGGHPGKIWTGTATTACPPGTSRELDAYVSRTPTSDRYEMNACFGPQASSQDEASVRSMLGSLRVLAP